MTTDLNRASLPLAVVAIGGNALWDPANPHPPISLQNRHTREALEKLLFLREDKRLLIVHGNGPQVGAVMRRSDLAHDVLTLHRLPLDVCGADTQGAMGYMIQRIWSNLICGRPPLTTPSSPGTRTATVITQVLVGAEDPALQRPSKPVGMLYTAEEKAALESEKGWILKPYGNRGFRRVVASPKPIQIIELPLIASLLETGADVIAVGGGGIPVVLKDGHRLVGIEAVIDKDRSAALAARQLGARTFVILTAVPQVMLSFGTPEARPLAEVSAAELRGHIASGAFAGAEGSMLPKVEAALTFIEGAGPEATCLITSPEELPRAFAGQGGTRIVSGA